MTFVLPKYPKGRHGGPEEIKQPLGINAEHRAAIVRGVKSKALPNLSHYIWVVVLWADTDAK